jgi:hypothetical protein
VLSSFWLDALMCDTVQPLTAHRERAQADETLKAAGVDGAATAAVCEALAARADELRVALLAEAAAIGTSTIRDFDWNVAVSRVMIIPRLAWLVVVVVVVVGGWVGGWVVVMMMVVVMMVMLFAAVTAIVMCQ